MRNTWSEKSYKQQKNVSGASWGKKTCNRYDAFDSNFEGTVAFIRQSLNTQIPTFYNGICAYQTPSRLLQFWQEVKHLRCKNQKMKIILRKVGEKMNVQSSLLHLFNANF